MCKCGNSEVCPQLQQLKGSRALDGFLLRAAQPFWWEHGGDDTLCSVLDPNCCSAGPRINTSVLLIFLLCARSGETRLDFCLAYKTPVPGTAKPPEIPWQAKSSSNVVLQGVAGTWAVSSRWTCCCLYLGRAPASVTPSMPSLETEGCMPAPPFPEQHSTAQHSK